MTDQLPRRYLFVATGIEEVDSFARNQGFDVIDAVPLKFYFPEPVNVTVKAVSTPRIGNSRPYLKKKKGRS